MPSFLPRPEARRVTEFSRGRAIGSHDTGVYTVANCVYLDGSGDDPANPGFYVGASKRVSVSVTGMTAEELKSEAALATLNTDGAVFEARFPK